MVDAYILRLKDALEDNKNSPLILGLTFANQVCKLYALSFLFDIRGMVLRQRRREGDDRVFVILDAKRDVN